eukprot:7369014-Prymnesium_polylepis.1
MLYVETDHTEKPAVACNTVQSSGVCATTNFPRVTMPQGPPSRAETRRTTPGRPARQAATRRRGPSSRRPAA